MGQNNSKGKERSQDNGDTLVVPNFKVSNSYNEQNLSQLQLTSSSKSVLNFDHYPTNFISIKSRVTLKSNDNLKQDEDNIAIKKKDFFNLFKWSSRSKKTVKNELADNLEKCKCKYLIIINEIDQISKEPTKQLNVGNSLTVSKFSRNKLLLEKLTSKTLLLNKSLIMFNTEMSRQICNLSKRPKSGSKLCVQKNCKISNFIKKSVKRKTPSIENLKPTKLKNVPVSGKSASSNKKSDGCLTVKKRKSFCLRSISSVMRRKRNGRNNKLSLSDTFCYKVSPSILKYDLTIKQENRAGDNGISNAILSNFNGGQNCTLLKESTIFDRKQSSCDRYTSTTVTTVDKYSQCSSQDPTLDIFLFPNLINIESQMDKFMSHANLKMMQNHLKKIKFEPSEKKVKIEQIKNEVYEVSSKNYVYIPTEKYSLRSNSLNKMHWSKAQNVKKEIQGDKNPILDRMLQLNGGDNNSIVELKLNRAMYTSSENVNILNFAERNETGVRCSKQFSEIINERCELLKGINNAIKKIEGK